MATLHPEYARYLEYINALTFDLMNVFKKTMLIIVPKALFLLRRSYRYCIKISTIGTLTLRK